VTVDLGDARSLAAPSSDDDSDHHREPHSGLGPSHHTSPGADSVLRPGLHPTGRIWLQERGRHVLGPGAQELLRRLDEVGSLNQAAKVIGIPYSKAYRLIDEIERGLGITLLTRQTGGIAGGGSRLTDEGRLVLERFEAFTRDADDALEALFHRHFDDLPIGAAKNDDPPTTLPQPNGAPEDH